MAAVLDPAVDAPARPVGAAVSDRAAYVCGGADVIARRPDW